jgi:asparagine synthase (glutamine-hydrolysing)
MCGIAGFCDYSNKSSEEVLTNMMNSIRHRGPNDSGISFKQYDDKQIGLGHRRLSIIDLSSCGHQPMNYEHFEIVFNGEIYNYLEIRKELEQHGYKFKSHSDTEVILTGFHKWGIKVVDKFIGMFAFGLFDKSAQKLYLVRDRIGVKYRSEAIILLLS